jgi:hypothetical protein
MSYTIKKTNGTVVATVADSDAVNISVNTDYSVALLGKHSPNYGETFNTNFIRLLENSANLTAPGSPLVGQLWFDTTPSNLGLNVCVTQAVGSTPAAFNPVALLTRSATAPTIYGLGKLWHDTTTNQLKSYDGAGQWAPIGVSNLDSLTDVGITTPTDGQVLKYNATTSTWVNGTDATGGGGGGGTSLPGNAAGVLTNDGTGNLSWATVGGSALPSQANQGGKFLKTDGTSASWSSITPSADSIVPLGSISGPITIDRSQGSIFTATAVGNFTLSLTNIIAGQSFTLIVTQDSTGSRSATYPVTFKFASGYKTLSTAPNAVDMLNVFYDGTTYYTTLTTGYTV